MRSSVEKLADMIRDALEDVGFGREVGARHTKFGYVSVNMGDVTIHPTTVLQTSLNPEQEGWKVEWAEQNCEIRHQDCRSDREAVEVTIQKFVAIRLRQHFTNIKA